MWRHARTIDILGDGAGVNKPVVPPHMNDIVHAIPGAHNIYNRALKGLPGSPKNSTRRLAAKACLHDVTRLV